MITLIIFLCLAFSIIATIFLTRKKFNNVVRVPLIVFCIAVALASMFLGLALIDAYRIGRSGELFAQKAIADFRDGNLPPLGQDVTQEEERQIKNIATSIPKGAYKIELYDRFGDLWEYQIEFENGDKYLCAVLSPGTFLNLRFFEKVEYSLLRFEKKRDNNRE